MRISHTQLERLPVVTESGTTLGKVTDVVYDIENYTVVQLVITSGLLKSHEYRIHPQQIKSITSKQIVVEDGLEDQKKKNIVEELPGTVTPAMMREME